MTVSRYTYIGTCLLLADGVDYEAATGRHPEAAYVAVAGVVCQNGAAVAFPRDCRPRISYEFIGGLLKS